MDSLVSRLLTAYMGAEDNGHLYVADMLKEAAERIEELELQLREAQGYIKFPGATTCM